MREVDIPWMGRHVRALRHEAHVAQVAVVDDLPEDLLVYRMHLAGGCGIHCIEQRRECVAQAEATAAAVADVEDALQLLVERSLVVKSGIAPVERVTRWRFETSLA